jgi:hypothetical protein
MSQGAPRLYLSIRAALIGMRSTRAGSKWVGGYRGQRGGAARTAEVGSCKRYNPCPRRSYILQEAVVNRRT